MIAADQIVKIRNKISPDTPIVVEGKKDKAVLEKLGFKNILPISGQSNERMLETLKGKTIKRVIILTDFDEEGGKKYKKLCKLFEKNGIKIDFYIRDRFNKIFKIHKIEELFSITKFIESGHYYESPPINKKIFNRSKFIRRRRHKKQLRKKQLGKGSSKKDFT